jgi:hypothetical protein
VPYLLDQRRIKKMPYGNMGGKHFCVMAEEKIKVSQASCDFAHQEIATHFEISTKTNTCYRLAIWMVDFDKS